MSRSTGWLLLLALTVAGLARAQEPDRGFAELKAAYDERRAALEETRSNRVETVRTEYRRLLLDIFRRYQDAGNLDGVRSTQEEVKRFRDTGAIPSPSGPAQTPIERARATHAPRLRTAREAGAQASLLLNQQYARALETLVQQLTQRGEIDEAIRARNALRMARAEVERLKGIVPLAGGRMVAGNAALGAKVTGAQDGAQLVDGVIDQHTGSSGYSHGAVPVEIVVELGQVTSLSMIRLLLWDGDDRFYRYKLELSSDGERWRPCGRPLGKRGVAELADHPVSSATREVDPDHRDAQQRQHPVPRGRDGGVQPPAGVGASTEVSLEGIGVFPAIREVPTSRRTRAAS